MRRKDLFIVLGLALLLGVYSGSNEVAQWAIGHGFGIGCRINFLSLKCDYPPDTTYNPVAYGLLAGVLIAAIATTLIFYRAHLVTIFVQLMGWIGLCAIAYDIVLQKPVLTSAKLINDTQNVLSSAIFASFLLLMFILRLGKVSMIRLLMAYLGSYLAKILLMLVFIGVSASVMGATELYLLYIVYAFGTFAVHVMTISALVSRTSFAPTLQEA
jgi:hypothetical protein